MSKKKMAAVIAFSALTALGAASGKPNPKLSNPLTSSMRSVASSPAPVNQTELREKAPQIWNSLAKKWPSLGLKSKAPKISIKELSPGEVDTLNVASDQAVIGDHLFVVSATSQAVVFGYPKGYPPSNEIVQIGISHSAFSIAFEQRSPMGNGFFKADYLPDFFTLPFPEDRALSPVNSDDLRIGLAIFAAGGPNPLIRLVMGGKAAELSKAIDTLVGPGTYQAVVDAPFEGRTPMDVLGERLSQSKNFRRQWAAFQKTMRQDYNLDPQTIQFQDETGALRTLGQAMSEAP